MNKKYFIPPKAKLELSKKNIKACTVVTIILFLFGLAGFYVEAAYHHSFTLSHVIYYSLFILTSVLFLVLSRLTQKKNSYRMNQALIMFTCSFFAGLMCFFITEAIDINNVICFYFALVVMMTVFELSPFFYTVIIIIFITELIYFNAITIRDRTLILCNLLFCTVMIFFAFFKRRLISTRERNRQEIEDKNRQLSVQNIELARQKHGLLTSKHYLEDAVLTQTQEMQLRKERIIRIQDDTIVSLSNLVENRDEDTGDHVLRTRDYVQLIAAKAYLTGNYPELNERTISLFIKAAPMHDIGKIVVPDAVLKKPGRLTPEEFDLIKLHTSKGGKIVQDVLGSGQDKEYVRIATEIATSHHEKYDGSGYPYGLKGTGIPLSARIMAVADVFDALVSPRCYKEPMPLEKAFSIIEEEAGTHFDPDLSRIFLESKDEVISILNRYQEHETA